MAAKSEEIAVADLMADSGVGFGTSGARGLAHAMTDRVCYSYTVGFLQYLERAKYIRPGEPVALAGDHRPSTPRILAACAAAVGDLGYDAVYCGRIPSPAVAAYGIRHDCASIMVTGSHIPDDRNGIKFNRPDGEILKADEAGIREQVVSVPCCLFDEAGNFNEPVRLPTEDLAAYRQYAARYLDFLPAGCLAGSRVLVYAHSSVATEAIAEVFEGLGAELLRRGASTVFVPVDTEAIRPEDVALGQQWAAHETFDIIVSTDGDGDRPLIGDEHGEWLRGDVAGVLCAGYLGADTVVTPVSSNSVVEACGWFESVRRTRIGSPFVIAEMTEAVAAGAQRVVGYEANGGFLTMCDLREGDRILPALPTRDALIVALAVLLLARKRGVPVSELNELLPPRFTASDRLQAFPVDISRARLSALAAGGVTAIQALFPELGEVQAIDSTDGLRITFSNQEVVHLRPSGNAPELRCYNEAHSVARVQALNRACMQILAAWRG